jgi:hypothetical protein
VADRAFGRNHIVSMYPKCAPPGALRLKCGHAVSCTKVQVE